MSITSSRQLVALGLVVALAAAACGPVNKQTAVRRIAAAARGTEIRYGRLSITSVLKSEPNRGFGGVTLPPGLAAALPGGLGGAPAPGPVALDVVYDPAQHLAALLAPAAAAARIGPTGGGGIPALVLFDGPLIYVRQDDAGEIGARSWLELDTKTLGPVGKPTYTELSQPRTLGDLAVISPITLVEAGYGMLTGSVKIDATAELSPPDGSIPEMAVEYRGNTSLDKAARQLHRDPDTERPTQHLLQTFAAHDDINAMSVWIGPSGDLAQLSVEYWGRPERGVKFGITFLLALDPPSSHRIDESVLTPPTPGQVVQVNDPGLLREALDQWWALSAGAAASPFAGQLP